MATILAFFGTAFWAVVGFFGSLLPNSSGLPSDVLTSLQGVAGYAAVWGIIFPFQTMWQILIVVFIFEAGLLGFKITAYILDLIANVAP